MLNMKTIDEIRRENLETAIGRAGTGARLAELSGTAPAYLSQIKNSTRDSKSGTPKTMGDDMARRIEEAIGEPSGWMDKDHALENSAGSEAAAPVEPSPARLQWVREDEAELLSEYRRMGPKEQGMFAETARKMPKAASVGFGTH